MQTLEERKIWMIEQRHRESYTVWTAFILYVCMLAYILTHYKGFILSALPSSLVYSMILSGKNTVS